MSTAARVAEALTGHKVKSQGRNYLVCCPAHDDTLPSLSLRDGDRGLMVHCFAGCTSGEIYTAIRKKGYKLDPGDTAREPLAKGSSEYQRRQTDKAAWLWSQRKPIVGSIAEKYLRETRKYSGPLPATLAFLPPLNPSTVRR
jgi:DNA primase